MKHLAQYKFYASFSMFSVYNFGHKSVIWTTLLIDVADNNLPVSEFLNFKIIRIILVSCVHIF